MRNKSLQLVVLLALFGTMVVSAAEKDSIKAAKKAAVKERIKEEWNAHFKFYGFVRGFLNYDTRENYTANGGLYFFAPKDQKLNEYGQDLNAVSNLQYVCLTSRLGIDVVDYRYKNTYFNAKVECDFGFTAAKTNVYALLRLRHAYVTAEWRDLDIAGNKKADLKLLMGQWWHPVSFPMPLVLGFDGGCPFDISNRSPQITFTSTFDKKYSLIVAAVFQAQYTSTGPEGMNVNYQKYGLIPEGFLSFAYSDNGFTLRTGVNVTTLRPRKYGTDAKGVEVIVDDRISSFIPFIGLEYKHKDLLVSAKTMYAQSGEHLNLMSGYGVSGVNENGNWTYTPMQSNSTWLFIQYGSKYKGSILGGYYKNFGTVKPLHQFEDGSYKYFSTAGACCDPGVLEAWRVAPRFQVQFGKFSVGLEYQCSAVKYGDASKMNEYGLALENQHWVYNHRVMACVQYAW